MFTIKQQNKEVIEIPVPSLAKIEKEKEKEKKKESKLMLATENDIIINYYSKTMTKRMVIN